MLDLDANDRAIVVTYDVRGDDGSIAQEVWHGQVLGASRCGDGLQVRWNDSRRTDAIFGPVDAMCTDDACTDQWRWTYPRAESDTQQQFAADAAGGHARRVESLWDRAVVVTYVERNDDVPEPGGDDDTALQARSPWPESIRGFRRDVRTVLQPPPG